MGFKTEPANLEDAGEIAEMMMSASSSPRIQLEFKNCKPEDWLAWYREAVEMEISSCIKYPEEGEALKTVDEESGKIAGFVVWGWSPHATELIWNGKLDISLPAGTNTALREKFTKALQQLEKDYQPAAGGYYELLDLAASPAFQRRGIGSQLVNIGLEKADRTDSSVFLSGSPMGVPVYAKLGFEEVGRIEIPLEEFGGEGSHVHVAMIRKPQQKL